MSDDRCPHDDRPTRCPVCCLAFLRQRLPALQRAITGPASGSAAGEFVRGGEPSWEPINTSALALLQDIKRAGGLDNVEAALNRERDPEALAQLRRDLRQWRGRASLILHEATAPYALTCDVEVDGAIRTRAIGCPVVTMNGDCAGPLRVHRDDDPESPRFTRPELIRCARDHEHEWTWQHGGWLRLGVLLGGKVQ